MGQIFMNTLEALDTLVPLLLKALTVITPIVNALAPVFGFASDHPILSGLAFLVGGGAVANLTARALNLVPLNSIFLALENGAAIFSRAGNAGAFRACYAPFEDFIVKFIIGSAQSVERGLRRDNKNESGSVK